MRNHQHCLLLLACGPFGSGLRSLPYGGPLGRAALPQGFLGSCSFLGYPGLFGRSASLSPALLSFRSGSLGPLLGFGLGSLHAHPEAALGLDQSALSHQAPDGGPDAGFVLLSIVSCGSQSLVEDRQGHSTAFPGFRHSLKDELADTAASLFSSGRPSLCSLCYHFSFVLFTPAEWLKSLRVPSTSETYRFSPAAALIYTLNLSFIFSLLQNIKDLIHHQSHRSQQRHRRQIREKVKI